MNPQTRTPVRIIGICGVVFALLAAFVPLTEIVELVNIGTLFAFVIVNLGVIVLRRTSPDLPRGYRVPFVPVLPDHRHLLCVYLMADCPGTTWRGSRSGWRSASSSTSRTAAATRACARAGRQPRG